jgi:hypothetical protein
MQMQDRLSVDFASCGFVCATSGRLRRDVELRSPKLRSRSAQPLHVFLRGRKSCVSLLGIPQRIHAPNWHA